MKSVVVDASVWVSWLRPQDANHDISLSWMKRYRRTQGLLIAPTILLVEVTSAVSRQVKQSALSREIILSLIEVSPMRLVPLDFSLIRTAVNVANDLQLRAGDATYAAVAYQLGVPLVSWDKEQLRRASSLVETYSPETYPF